VGVLFLEPILYKNSAKKAKCAKHFTSSEIKKGLYYIFIFFVTGAPFIGATYPFGISVFASAFSDKIPYVSGAVVLFSLALFPSSPIYMATVFCSMLLFSLIKRNFNVKSPVLLSSVSSGCFFVSSVFSKLLWGFCLYDLAVIMLSAIASFCFTMIFIKAKSALHELRALSSESLIPLCVLFTVCAMGIFNSGVSGKYIIFIITSYICMCISRKNGTAYGTVTGVVLGIICGFPTYNFSFFIALFSLSALFCGIFSYYGKICLSLSYITASLLISFYGSDVSTARDIIFITITASILFLLTPDKYLLHITDKNSFYDSPGQRIRFLMKHKLSECSSSIKELSEIYSDITPSSAKVQHNASFSFFDKATSRLCEKCTNQQKCWLKSYMRTYSSFFVLHIICEKKGTISFSDIPEYLIKKCLKRNELIKTFTSAYNIYRLDRFWECRFMENRHSISKQLSCISDTVLSTSTETDVNVTFNMEAEKKIRKRLFRDKIPYTHVIVSESDIREIDLFVSQTHCVDSEKIEKSISLALNENYVAVPLSKTHIHLSPMPPFSLNISVIQNPKETSSQCGDSILCTNLRNGKYMIILSDGMGSGKEAFYNSQFSVQIAEKLLNSNFNTKDAIDIINSVLLLKSAETSFATVDLSLINLYDLSFSLYKLGASYSFIKRGQSTKTISCDTLPAGTFSKSDISKTIHTLSEGDALIMVSDGVVTPENLKTVQSVISEYIGNSPEVLAEKIRRVCSGAALRDDTSIIVAFAEKNV